MKIRFISTLAAVAAIATMSAPPALAQRRADANWQGAHWQGDGRHRDWDAANSYRAGGRYQPRRLSRGDDIYRGHDGRYYCRRSDGTTGLVLGALAGGLLGNAIGGNRLGTLLGAGGGAVLGRSIDRGQVRCR
jgi:uncharacterized protein YcfJ